MREAGHHAAAALDPTSLHRGVTRQRCNILAAGAHGGPTNLNRGGAPLLPLLGAPRFRAQQHRAHRTPDTLGRSRWSWHGGAPCEAPSQERAGLQEGIDPEKRGRNQFSKQPPPSLTNIMQLATARGDQTAGRSNAPGTPTPRMNVVCTSPSISFLPTCLCSLDPHKLFSGCELRSSPEKSGARNLRKFVAGSKIQSMGRCIQRPSWVLVFLVHCFALRFDPPAPWLAALCSCGNEVVACSSNFCPCCQGQCLPAALLFRAGKAPRRELIHAKTAGTGSMCPAPGAFGTAVQKRRGVATAWPRRSDRAALRQRGRISASAQHSHLRPAAGNQVPSA